ncbi:MAG: GNAT family N-acetyltransferase [Longimicrobiales bacterium]|nr:GNAT family N-acetyltransferase [Longimicrobiales bacterium]
MRAELWPEGTVAEHRAELPTWVAAEGTCAYVAELPVDGRLEVVGFLEGRLRSHADGCATAPVGYLEGWYVVPSHRRQGVGRALFDVFEGWARARGCRELASDTWPENAGSIAAHRRLGFEEVDRVVTFRKSLYTGIRVPPSARPPLSWDQE